MKTYNYEYLGQEKDISDHFYEIGNTYFNIQEMTNFDAKNLTGTIKFDRYERKARVSFNGHTVPFAESQSWTFPPAYSDKPEHPITLSFVDDNIVRIRTSYNHRPLRNEPSIMLISESKSVKFSKEQTETGIILSTSALSVELVFSPFSLIIKDSMGKVLTQTLNYNDGMNLLNCNPLPFSYVRDGKDMKKYSAASFSIFPGEHFYGLGESFTQLDKTGQKIQLWTRDAHGVESQDMYKPIPFYMSSRGYGIFAHTSASVTCDLGHSYQEAQTIFIGDDNVDLFVMAGSPKEILTSYSTLTGHSEMPPLWSFGLWMGRITYESEAQAKDVAKKLKEYRIPCDVIHLDTGWFEKDWSCDYKFAATRFENPQQMVTDLKKEGYHISLWQLPYFTPSNALYEEIIQNDLAVKNSDGKMPTDDAILDFSNPQAVTWYQEKIKSLLNMGVSAIKVDFGEAAPITGAYHSGKSGAHEHNLYPLRYNKAVADITKEVNDESIIWARSAWAGSQRYPLHWGGDCENTNMGMLTSLRGGLSLGMSGFTFWSHDAGGFVRKSPEELYKRWMFMAIFTSHIRCHGWPPKEPWNYSEEFLQLFREQMELRYKLMPYIYAQGAQSAALGHPMMKSMFLEFPNDRNCTSIEDQYMFGNDMLIAPLFEDNAKQRDVYLPEGIWIDFFTHKCYEGGRWYTMDANQLQGIALVKDGSVIPMVDTALTTKDINWSTVKYHWYTVDETICTGVEFNQLCDKLVEINSTADIQDKLVMHKGK